MSRYTGPVCRLCRAEGTKLFLKGDRCYTEKCSISRRETKPGKTATSRRGKVSEYGLRLREKQKLRRFYGMNESQFRRYFAMANRLSGQTGHNFLRLLEERLDNVVYRLGIANSRQQARQLVRHGHINLDGQKVDIPSCSVKPGQIVSIREGSRDIPVIKENMEVVSSRTIPEWLEIDGEKLQGKILSDPSRDQMDVPVNEQLVVEFYAR